MAFALVVNGIKGSAGSDSITTDAADTSGSNLIVIQIGTFLDIANVVSDNKSNMWNPLTDQVSSSRHARLYYAINPTVGTGHTFSLATSGGFPSIAFQAFSGAKTTSPFDVENGAAGSGVSSLATGSITPSEGSEVVIAGLCNIVDTASINGGFAITDQNVADSFHVGIAMAYLIQTSAAAANPTFSWTTARDTAAVIASFKVPSVSALSVVANN